MALVSSSFLLLLTNNNCWLPGAPSASGLLLLRPPLRLRQGPRAHRVLPDGRCTGPVPEPPGGGGDDRFGGPLRGGDGDRFWVVFVEHWRRR